MCEACGVEQVDAYFSELVMDVEPQHNMIAPKVFPESMIERYDWSDSDEECAEL